MPADVGEDLAEEFRAAVQHEGMAREIGRRIDEAEKLYHPRDPIEAAELGLCHRQQAEPNIAGESLTFFSREIRADPADNGSPLGIGRSKSREKQQISCKNCGREDANGLRGWRQRDPKLRESIGD